MKNVKKNIINFGEDFAYKKGIFNNPQMYDFKSLNQCFNRWSDAKDFIYYKYERMLRENTDNFNFLYYGIKSYNCNIITLHAIVEKNGKKYYLYITPSYNYYEEIEGANNEE